MPGLCSKIIILKTFPGVASHLRHKLIFRRSLFFHVVGPKLYAQLYGTRSKTGSRKLLEPSESFLLRFIHLRELLFPSSNFSTHSEPT